MAPDSFLIPAHAARTFFQSAGPLASAGLILGFFIFGGPAAAVPSGNPDGAVEWVWSGAVTSNSAVVKAKLKPCSGGIRLLVATESTFHDFRSIPENGFAQPDPDRVLTFKLENLEPDTLYHYSVEVEGIKSVHGRFRTFTNGPMSFQTAFASCASTGSNHRIFATIKNLEPSLFIHMGDFHYENIKRNDPSRYRRAYDRVLTAPRQSELYRSLPIAYVWDDHDYGPDDADGMSPGRPAALKTYRQCVPHYPLQGAGTIHQAFSVGRVRFILTDVRSERTPADEPDGPRKTMLGQLQRDWLVQEMAAARDGHALVVWVNVVPWITRNARGSDHGWEPYSYERTLIADKIKSLDLVDRLVIVSGDAHMVAIDDGTNSDYASNRESGDRAFPVIHAAPLDRYPRGKGGPYSHGFHAKKRFFGILKIQQFGFMKVRDDGQIMEIEFSGHNADGNLLSGMLLKMRCDDAGCRTID